MRIIRTVADLREATRLWHADRQTIALVPTMGALHAGHLALVELGRRRADRLIVSVFVNPTQFAAHEDLDFYPRTFEQDRDMLRRQGVDIVYAPNTAEMYPAGFATTLDPGGVAKVGLEDASRPHFFQAVATVVAKLFVQSAADVAIFGEKDYQQLLVIRQMALDLDIPVRVLSAPTVREADGLAMSSRNRYLGPDDRRTAAVLPSVLTEVARLMRQGSGSWDAILAWGRKELAQAGLAVDYLEVRDAVTLTPVSRTGSDMRVLAGVRLGTTRLIDNIGV